MFRRRLFIALFLFVSLYSGALYTFATTYVAPGTILDPAGLPGAYTVGPVLSYGEAVTTGHDNEVLYVDGSGDLASDSLFTRTSTGATNIEMTQGADYAAFQLGNTVSAYGLPGIGLFREDSAGTVGSGFIGIMDASGVGATPYTIFLRTDDVATSTAAQIVLLPNFSGMSISDGDGITSTVSLSSGGQAHISADNDDDGGDDHVGFYVDLASGLANQDAIIRYDDTVRDFRATWNRNGLTLDFNGGNQTAGQFYRFPTADGSNGQVLTTDGLGVVRWETVSGGSASAAGSQYEIQFNDGSDLMDSDSDFTWDGMRLLVQNNSTDHSVYIGPGAGNSNPTAASHIAIGYTALQSIAGATTGNTAIGTQALASVNVAQYNTALGYASGDTLSSGSYNVYLGANADAVGGSPDASYNTVVGANAKTYQNGSYNVLLGYDTGSSAYAGYNTIIGTQSGNDVGMSSYNVLLGYDVEMSTTGIAGSVGIGKQAVISASDQFALADSITQMKLRGINYTLPSADGSSGYVLTTDGSGSLSWAASGGGLAFTVDGQTMYAGTSSGSSLDPGTGNNLFIGYSAGRLVTSGHQNTLLGAFAGDGLNTGASNTFIGSAAGLYTTSGENNVFIGSAAGKNQLAVSQQIAIGTEALRGSTTTSENTGTANLAIGYNAGYANTSGSNNYYIGWGAGSQNTTGGDNIFIGYTTGGDNITGNYNTLIGNYNALGAGNVSDGIVIGYNSTLGSYSGSIVLGRQATATAANQFVAGSTTSSVTDVYFGGGALSTVLGDAPAYTIHGTGANSNGTNGGDLILAGGQAYAGGTSLGGSILFKTSQDFSDTALQTRMKIDKIGAVTIGDGSCGGDVRLCLIENRVNSAGNVGLHLANSATNTTTDGVTKTGLMIGVSGDYSGSGGSDTVAYGIFLGVTTGGDQNYDIYSTSGAYLSTSGTWTNASSRTLKENFVEASGSSVLDKLRSLSIYEWNYLTDDPSIVHIGPVAEDFKQVFGYGQDNKSISTIDPAGIALAAIKELDIQVRSLQNLISAQTSIAGQLSELALRVKSLVVGSSDRRTGITLYDEVTGEPYCLSVANGSPKSTQGECSIITPAPVVSNTNSSEEDPSTSEGENGTDESNSDEGGDIVESTQTTENTGGDSGENTDTENAAGPTSEGEAITE